MEYCFVANGLTKKYRKFVALDNLNMNIKCGDIYGLVGKNGSGKTTLIRLICGLQYQNEGHYSLFGASDCERKKLQDARKRIGAVVETPSIYLDMTARDNMKHQCDLLGVPDYDSIDEILDYVGLGDTDKKVAKNFSLGMRQRLGIALVLVGNPDFIILDEPTNGLDPQGIVEIRELIIKLNKDKHITFLISSHILGELSKLATNYGFIEKGRLLKEITAEELEENCRKCTVVNVSNVKPLIKYCDEIGAEYKVLSNTELNIYGQIDINAICDSLKESGATLLSVTQKDEDLEAYYINLVGGKEND